MIRLMVYLNTSGRSRSISSSRRKEKKSRKIDEDAGGVSCEVNDRKLSADRNAVPQELS